MTYCRCEVTCPKPSHPQVGRAVSIEIYDPAGFLLEKLCLSYIPILFFTTHDTKRPLTLLSLNLSKLPNLFFLELGFQLMTLLLPL